MLTIAGNTFAVIGSNCFTGSHIVDALLERGAERVVGVSRSPQYKPLFLAYASRDLSRFEFHQVDLTGFSAMRAVIDRVKPSVVINVAALSEVALSNHQPVEYFRTNTLGVVELCNYLRRQDWLRRYVHISSAEILGSCPRKMDESALFNPSTPYAVSKAAADQFINTLIANFNFPATLIRSTNVYGRHQQLFKIIPRTVIYLKLGKTIELHGGGRSRKNFIHIRDVVDGLLRAIERDRTGTYHLSMDSEDTVADVVRCVCQRMERDFSHATRIVGERLGQDARYWLDCTKARHELDWQPRIPFEDGVDETIAWVEANWDQIRREPLEYVHKS